MSTEATGGGTPSERTQAGGTQSPSAEALEREIERTRHELGETVEALVAKTDVKARVQHRAARVAGDLRRTARDLTGKARSKALAVTRKAGDEAHGVQKQVAERGPAIARDNRAKGGIAAVVLGALTLAWLTGRRRRHRRRRR